jgi:hypothetical protein
LADEKLKETMKANLKELLEGDTGKIEFEGKIRTRKEIFDILVERASITEEEKREIEERRKEEERRRLEQTGRDAEDALKSLLNNPIIPDSVKKLFKRVKI